MPSRIPVTIITGFLGSGKTTLINRILTGTHGRRIAVIENEFGEADIDAEILLENREEQIVELMNGCICCTVRGDLVRILASLASKRKAGALAFEHVVIETTGLADPGPVAQTFFVEPECVCEYRLDGMVTLVDAKHGGATLTRERVAQSQVGFADRILLSKSDLIPEAETAALIARLKRMNGRATVTPVELGCVEMPDLLALGGFELTVGDDTSQPPAHATHGHGDDVASFVIREHRAYDLEKLEGFMSLLVERYGPDMLRYKGVLNIAGREERIVFQGVHALLGSEPGKRWRHDEKRSSTMVFIGRRLPRASFEKGLASCVEGSAADPAVALREAA